MSSKNNEAQKCANTLGLSSKKSREGNIDMNSVQKNELTFQKMQFHPVTHDGNVWLTSSELASALGYKKSDAVTQIYSRYHDEFSEKMSTTLKMSVVRKTGVVDIPVRVFSLRGAHLIAMFASTPVAKEFRRWVLDILDREVAQGNVNPAFDFDFRMHSVNSNALCVLLTQSREIFRKDLEPALRLIDSPVAGKICGRLTDACAIAHSINKALERNVSREGALLQ